MSPPPSAPDAANGMKGRYRLTLTGFTVNKQTWDNPLELDGKGDEVYLVAHVVTYDSVQSSRFPNVKQKIVRSEIYGDVNGFEGRRIQAGSASSKGGLVSGDNVPDNTPWLASGAPQPNRLPMLLWEGELIQGRSVAVVTPTVWEWDDKNELFRRWTDLQSALVDKWLKGGNLNVAMHRGSVRPTQIPMMDVSYRYQKNGLVPKVAIDLPLGMLTGRAAFSELAPRSDFVWAPEAGVMSFALLGEFAAASTAAVFFEQAIALTPYTIEQALTNPAAVGARAPGEITVQYVDVPELQGSYTLYLHVERLP